MLASALACACAFPFDMLTIEETIIEQVSPEFDPLADDRIETKNPQYDPNRTIIETFDECEVQLNKSGAVTTLNIPQDQSEISEVLHPDYRAAFAAHRDLVVPSMEMVDMALKPFNDGLYAAVEVGAQQGELLSRVNKRAALEGLLTHLVQRASAGTPQEQPLAQDAAGRVAAALQLAGASPAVSGAILARSQQLATEFQADPFFSKPLGFYTWTPTLSAIFRQDRFLQQPLPLGEAASIAAVFQGEPQGMAAYRGVLDLYAGLTNPSFHRSILDLLPLVPDASALSNLGALQQQLPGVSFSERGDGCSPFLAFWPPSDSPENKLFRAVQCDGQGAYQGSLIDLLIKKIQTGALDLTPTETSGFYDRQLHALETLLVTDRAPEKDHLLLTRRYKEKLVETFKTLITQRRETHVKQVESPSFAGGASAGPAAPPKPVDIYPQLPVEPFPTFYLRTARAYAFLHGVLELTMGSPFINQARRLHEDGTESAQVLDEELTAMTRRVYGLAIVAARSIGMATPLSNEEAARYNPEKCEEEARDWLAKIEQDGDLWRDPRVMTPIQRAPDGTTQVWAVIGVRAVPVDATFAPSHLPEATPRGFCTIRSVIPNRRVLLIGKQIEVSLRQGTSPLDRAEFRALCDNYKTPEAIVQALEAR